MSARTASVLSVNNDLPIRTDEAVHSGKVRAVYWLTAADSARLIATNNYDVAAGSQLAVMVISDRISAFDCIWHGEGGMGGVPGKGAALNTVSRHWFDAFSANGLAGHHILDVPHPLVWIVQRTQPIMVEAIARQYITGYPPSSPAIALFKDQELVYMMERHQIEGSSPQQIAANLQAAYAEHC